MSDDKKPAKKLKQATAPPAHDITQSMPFSNDAEKGVLSCFLHNPADLLPDARTRTHPEAFYHPGNRLLYNVMQELATAGKPIEYIALSQHLQDTKQIDFIGGQGALAELLDFVPTPAHYGYYMGILNDKWKLRRIIGHCTTQLGRCYEYQEDVPELVRIYGEDTVELVHQMQAGDGAEKGSDLAEIDDERIATAGQRGIPTGLPWFDRYFGGLQKTALILVGGKRGAGKSSLARQIGWRAARGVPGVDGMTGGIPPVAVDLITVEMSKVQYYECLCCLEGVSSDSVLKQEYSAQEMEIFRRVRADAKKIPLRIHDDIKNISECCARIQLGVMKRNVRVVVVDMPQRLTGNQERGKSRERELSEIFWMLKETAKNLAITIIAPIHLNSDLGALGAQDCENHADQVIIMAQNSSHEPTLIEPRQKVIFKSTKNRFGPAFKRCLYWFDGPHYHFQEDGETDMDILTKEEARATKKKK